jgi:hypothetical protein
MAHKRNGGARYDDLGSMVTTHGVERYRSRLSHVVLSEGVL